MNMDMRSYAGMMVGMVFQIPGWAFTFVNTLFMSKLLLHLEMYVVLKFWNPF